MMTPPALVWATFDSAIQITSGQQVRVAGRKVGEVGDVKLVGGRAVVQLNITDDSVWPLPRRTRARIRSAGSPGRRSIT